MTVTVLRRGLVALIGLVVLYSLYALATPWRTLTIGDYQVRQNKITGKVEMRSGEKWTRIEDDPYAEPLPDTKLLYVAVRSVTWGPDGLLCGRFENRTNELLRGRLALRLIRKEIKRDLRVPIGGDRTLRLNVDLPPGQLVPFVIDTNLETPDTRKIKTILTIQPTAYSGT